MDPSLLGDFLTEAGELLEQLDQDLVQLESVAAEEAEAAELLQRIFRALHTVKGAAGFLNLGELTRFAHAAEDALNVLRKGEVAVSAGTIDLLLRSVDVLREMVEALGEGRRPEPCPPALLEELQQVAQGQPPEASPEVPSEVPSEASPEVPAEGAPAAVDTQPADAQDPQHGQIEPMVIQGADSSAVDNAAGSSEAAAPPTAVSGGEEATMERVALALPDQKRDLVGFMAQDLREAAEQVRQVPGQDRADAAAHLSELAEALGRTAEFFELRSLTALAGHLQQAAAQLPALDAAPVAALAGPLGQVADRLAQQAEALEQGQVIQWPQDLGPAFAAALGDAAGEPVGSVTSGNTPSGGIGAEVTASASSATAPRPAGAPEQTRSPAAADAPADPTERRSRPDRRSGEERRGGGAGGGGSTAGAGGGTEATIRVEVSRLETLLNLVGQMVLTKNRVLGLSRRLQDHALPQEMAEQVTAVAHELDRLTGNLQMGVMRTRMQPLAKLFDRYPRVIRDIARATGKQIQLQITGRDTEVDKSVLELLADPLVHLLRNSADHGIEPPDARQQAGKPAGGTIHLLAEHQGSHVRIAVQDDGRGLDRARLAAKAIERGLTTAEQVQGLSDQEVYRFIFAPGFSTAEQVSDLSGRGVGMDVVRTNVAKMNGQISIDATPGRGTTISILIPLTVAILPAMVVQVHGARFCVPLQRIAEIVRPEACRLSTIQGQPVIRLREGVLPLLDLRQRLGEGQVRCALSGMTPSSDNAPAGDGPGQRAPKPGQSESASAAPGTAKDEHEHEHEHEHAVKEASGGSGGSGGTSGGGAPRFALVVHSGGQTVALGVDRLIGQQDIVIKPLGEGVAPAGPFSGATILEDGQVSLILDIPRLLQPPPREETPRQAA